MSFKQINLLKTPSYIIRLQVYAIKNPPFQAGFLQLAKVYVTLLIMHNTNSENGMIIHQTSPVEKKFYEDNMKQLKEENIYLKSVLDKILLSEKKK